MTWGAVDDPCPCPWKAGQMTTAEELYGWVYGSHPLFSYGTLALDRDVHRKMERVKDVISAGALARWESGVHQAILTRDWCWGLVTVLDPDGLVELRQRLRLEVVAEFLELAGDGEVR